MFSMPFLRFLRFSCRYWTLLLLINLAIWNKIFISDFLLQKRRVSWKKEKKSKKVLSKENEKAFMGGYWNYIRRYLHIQN